MGCKTIFSRCLQAVRKRVVECLEIIDVGCNLKQFDDLTWLTLTLSQILRQILATVTGSGISSPSPVLSPFVVDNVIAVCVCAMRSTDDRRRQVTTTLCSGTTAALCCRWTTACSPLIARCRSRSATASCRGPPPSLSTTTTTWSPTLWDWTRSRCRTRASTRARCLLSRRSYNDIALSSTVSHRPVKSFLFRERGGALFNDIGQNLGKVAKLAKTGYEVCAHDFAHLLSTWKENGAKVFRPDTVNVHPYKNIWLNYYRGWTEMIIFIRVSQKEHTAVCLCASKRY